MNGVEWLLLDIGGVLEIVDDDAWPEQLAARWEQRFGLDAGDYRARITQLELPDATVHSGVAEEYWGMIADALGVGDDDRAAMVIEFWDAYCGHRNDPLLDYLSTLRGHLGLAILSNSGDGAREEEERRYAFSTLFDPILYSHEIGVTKPDSAAFEIALSRLGAPANRVLFVDNAPENVDAARRLGLRAHLHVDTASTIAAIEQALRPRD